MIVISCIQTADFSKRVPFPSNNVEATGAVFQAYVETKERDIVQISISQYLHHCFL